MSFLTTPRLQVSILSSEDFIVLTLLPPASSHTPSTHSTAIAHHRPFNIKKSLARDILRVSLITVAIQDLLFYIYVGHISPISASARRFFPSKSFSFLADRVGYLCWPSDRHTALQLGVCWTAINISRADYPFSHYWYPVWGPLITSWTNIHHHTRLGEGGGCHPDSWLQEPRERITVTLKNALSYYLFLLARWSSASQCAVIHLINQRLSRESSESCQISESCVSFDLQIPMRIEGGICSSRISGIKVPFNMGTNNVRLTIFLYL